MLFVLLNSIYLFRDEELPTLYITKDKEFSTERPEIHREKYDKEKVQEMRQILRAITRHRMEQREQKNLRERMLHPHRTIHKTAIIPRGEVSSQSFFPFLDFFRLSEKDDDHSKKELEDKKREIVEKIVKAPSTNKTDKEENKSTNKEEVTSNNLNNAQTSSKAQTFNKPHVIEDIKKNIQSKKSRHIIKRLLYVAFVVLVGGICYQMGKRAESENYLRVLQPDQ